MVTNGKGTRDYQSKNHLMKAPTRPSRRDERKPTGLLREHPNVASDVHKERWAGVYQFVVGWPETEVYLSEAQQSVPVLSHDSG